jgi:hypothetical protein
MKEVIYSLPFVALTVVCWGVYGPVLHEGQQAMGASKLRPFLCVGLAYFVIAVIVPLVMLNTAGEKGAWDFKGTLWSLAAGVAGAVGALGIIMAFNVGGKPAYVMPLVFGLAPVANTVYVMTTKKLWGDVNPFFLAGLILVAVGAACVLGFAPKATPHAAPPAPAAVSEPSEDTPAAEDSGSDST